jgi:steroid 5-alpha reductase family enzyme
MELAFAFVSPQLGGAFGMTHMIAILTAAIAMSAVFALAWLWASHIDNYSIVDATWAFGIGGTACFWLAVSPGDCAIRMVAAVAVGFWSLRLGGYLCRRIHRMHPQEDPRYAKLREVWKERKNPAFFWFFQLQAASVVLLALPFLAISNSSSGWGIFESVGLAVIAIGLVGESLADRQMATFKRGNSDFKAVCRDGLWRYSRHPNYFFESVIWWGFYLVACGSPWGWGTIHAPIAITWLLLRVTGIPPTEAAAVTRKGDAYRDYQRTTSPFIPLPPKSLNS